jgi:multidrug resistance efflux pump
MDIQEIDGIEYVKKSDVENIIKQRIDKVAARANEAEQVAKELQQKLEKATKSDATIDLLHQQIETMKSELTKSEQKYERFQALSKHGFTDAEIIDAIEWTYEKSQQGLKKGEQTALADWLDNIVSNPEQAPAILRPHIPTTNAAPQVEANTAPQVEASTQSQLAELGRLNEAKAAPQTNNNVRSTPEPSNIIERGLKDPEFYAQNREDIRKAWLSTRRRGEV